LKTFPPSIHSVFFSHYLFASRGDSVVGVDDDDESLSALISGMSEGETRRNLWEDGAGGEGNTMVSSWPLAKPYLLLFEGLAQYSNAASFFASKTFFCSPVFNIALLISNT
jgi:hypothetical protein